MRSWSPCSKNQDQETDGLGAFLLRMGPNRKTPGPDPRASGGQHYLVVNGSLDLDGKRYPAWSTVFVGAVEAPLLISAGPQGLEMLILQYPRQKLQP